MSGTTTRATILRKPQTPESARARPRRGRSFRAACRILSFLLLLVGLLVLYLAVVGFPETVTERVRERFAEEGYDVRLERVRFNPMDGLVADGFRIFLDDADRYPAVEAVAVVLGFDPRVWWRGQHGVQWVHMRGGRFRMAADGPLIDPAGPHILNLENVDAKVVFEEGGIRLARMNAEWRTMNIRGRGFVVRDRERPLREEPARPVALRDFTERHSEWLPGLVEDLNTITFRDPPRLRFDVLINPAEPSRNMVSVRMEGEATQYRGLIFDGWEMELQMDGNEIRIPVCKAFHQQRRLEGRAALDMETEEAEAHVYINVLPVYWRNLMPALLREYMELARIHLFGPTEAELNFAKAPWREFGRRIEGWIKVEHLDAHGVWLETVEASLSRQHEQIRLDDIVAEIGRNGNKGPAHGHAAYHLQQGVYHGQVRASIDPHAVLPVAGYSENAAEIIQALSFSGALPSVDVSFSGTIPPDATFNFAGHARGSNFLYHGLIIRSFESTLLLTNRVMRLDPLHVEREEGRLDGWYEHDFNRRIADLDVVSGLDPKTLARVGSDTIGNILRPFRFEGPVRLHVHGRVDYGEHKETDYTASGHAEQVGWRWIIADTCAMDWVAQGDRIIMTNMHLNVYGGEMEGDVLLERIGDEVAHYAVRARVHEVVFDQLLRAARQTEMEVQEGRLSGRIELEGLAEDDWRASLAGHGRVRIREGQVFQIPLLGGLSQLLSRIYPRLGFAVQTDARADFDIGARRITSDNIRIEGTLLSLRAHGTYHLDDALDFTIQVQLLRRGLLVDAVRLVTYPVSRLLQFRLDGTLSEPRWVIDSLPRELPGLFEKEE